MTAGQWAMTALAALVILATIWMVVDTRRRERADEDRQDQRNREWNRAMSSLLGHVVMRGYDAQVTRTVFSIHRRDGGTLLSATIDDFSPTVLLDALKDLPDDCDDADDDTPDDPDPAT